MDEIVGPPDAMILDTSLGEVVNHSCSEEFGEYLPTGQNHCQPTFVSL